MATRWAVAETYLYGLRVVEVSAQVHQQLGHPGGHVVGAGEDAGAQTEDAGVTSHQVCGNRGKRGNDGKCQVQFLIGGSYWLDGNSRTDWLLLGPQIDSRLFVLAFYIEETDVLI